MGDQEWKSDQNPTKGRVAKATTKNVKPGTNMRHYTKLGYLNCQSVRNKANEVLEFIIDNEIDICALAETWLSSNTGDQRQITEMTPAGYSLTHMPRKGRGGGVGVILKDTLPFKVISSPESSSFECIQLMITATSVAIRLVTIYRVPPNQKNRITQGAFITEFALLLESLATATGRLVIIGDFNIHWDDNNNYEQKQLKELLEMHNLHQHITEPTHSKGHTLDFVITRENDGLLQHAEVGPLFSDHSALLCDLKTSKPHPRKEWIQYRKLNAIDFNKFNLDLSTALQTNNTIQPVGKVAHYNHSLSSVLEQHAPIKSKEIVVREMVPWINEDILAAKRERRKCERIWRSTRLTVHREIYIAQKSKVKLMCDEAKKGYLKDKINNCENDQSKLFKLAESLLHGIPKTILPDHESIEDLVKDFIQFFIQKIQKIRKKLDSVGNTRLPPSMLNSPLIKSRLTSFRLATSDLISKVIKSSSSATCDLDPIPTKLLKLKCLEAVLPTLTSIINDSLQNGQFPSEFKVANVCPILKKPSLDRNEFKNYRPVSNLPFVSKIIEKIVAKELNEHMAQNELMEKFQSAYRKGHSTETALLRVQSDILKAIDEGNAAYLVLLDLSAAFDTIDHQILLTLMKDHLGIGGKVLDWFHSYLHNRKQSVVINGVKSSPSELSYGVPQGSVLGPLLFCIYMIPLSQIFKKYNMIYHIYADDTQIYYYFDAKSETSAVNSRILIENCIEEIREWMTQSRLKLNDDKTEFLVISLPYYKNKLKDVCLNIGDSQIQTSPHCRNLGVIFDSNMDMKKHVANVCRSSFYQLRNIGSIRKYLSEEACAKLIHAFVTSRIDYCNSVLANLPKCLYSKLQKVLNVAARILTLTKKFDHISPVLVRLHWLPIPLRVHYKIILLTFKCLYGLGPLYLKDLLTLYEPNGYELRSSNAKYLETQNHRMETYGNRSFRVAAPVYWNSLPAHLRHEENFSTFKNELKTHLFTLFRNNTSLYIY